ncbi:hypothetical protein COOONC_22147 [Cooperia oncophora]
MTVAAERIERNYRRRSSFIQEQRREKLEALAALDEVEVDVVDGKPKARSSRHKSVSVCLPMSPMMPERSNAVVDFPRPKVHTAHRSGATSRFIVERNCQPESLEAFELRSVRLRGLSTSEVFHEPPAMYVYRERPPPTVYRKKTNGQACIAYIKKRKHTLCAWTCGIAAIALMTTIIGLQIKGDL